MDRRHARNIPSRFHAWALVGLIAVVGCTTPSKKKSPSSPPPNASAGQAPFWQDGAPNSKTGSPTINVPTGPNLLVSGTDPDVTGILAGRVVDQNLSRAVATASVRAEPTGEFANQAPIDAETTPDGHFYIRGLTPGRNYRLVARTNQNGRTIGGEVVARPPDARLLITVSAEYQPSEPAPQRPLDRGAVGVTPISPSAELLTPRAGGNFYPPPNPENVASINSPNIPQASIPVPGLPETSPQRNWDPNYVGGPVPDCLISNGRLLTLRLNDADG